MTERALWGRVMIGSHSKSMTQKPGRGKVEDEEGTQYASTVNGSLDKNAVPNTENDNGPLLFDNKQNHGISASADKR